MSKEKDNGDAVIIECEIEELDRVDPAVENLQLFLGWLNHVESNDIVEMLKLAGHHHDKYHEEKIAEFQKNRVLFAYHWTNELYKYWKIEEPG